MNDISVAQVLNETEPEAGLTHSDMRHSNDSISIEEVHYSVSVLQCFIFSFFDTIIKALS